jgi:hypothetical protein
MFADEPHRCAPLACWRWPFLAQVVMCMPLVVAFVLVPFSHLAISQQKLERLDSYHHGVVPVKKDAHGQDPAASHHHGNGEAMPQSIERLSASMFTYSSVMDVGIDSSDTASSGSGSADSSFIGSNSNSCASTPLGTPERRGSSSHTPTPERRGLPDGYFRVRNSPCRQPFRDSPTRRNSFPPNFEDVAVASMSALPSYQNDGEGDESQLIDDVDAYGFDRKRSLSESSISSHSSQRRNSIAVPSSATSLRSRKNNPSRWHTLKRRLSLEGSPALGRIFGSPMSVPSASAADAVVVEDTVPTPADSAASKEGGGLPSQVQDQAPPPVQAVYGATSGVLAASPQVRRNSSGGGGIDSTGRSHKSGEQYVSLSMMRHSREFDLEEHGPWDSTLEGFWTVMAGCTDTLLLLRLPVYVFVVLCMSALYFVVTGVQFWGTAYMMVALGAPQVLSQLGALVFCLAVVIGGCSYGCASLLSGGWWRCWW